VIVNGLAAIWFMIGYTPFGVAMIRTAVAMSGARPRHDHAAVSDRREPHKDLHQGRTPLPPVTTTTVSPSDPTITR